MGIRERATRITRRGQTAAAELMADSCIVKRVVTVVDPVDYTTTETETEVYAGKYRLTTYEPYETVVTSAGRMVVQQRYQAHFPVGVGPFAIGDLIYPADSDRVLRVAGLLEKTYQTAQRLLVDEETNREDA